MNDRFHPELPLETIPCRVDEFEMVRTSCCYVLRRVESDRVVVLNNSSAMVWYLCDSENTVGTIIEALQEGFPEAADGMAKDVFRTLDQLQDEGVITLS